MQFILNTCLLSVQIKESSFVGIVFVLIIAFVIYKIQKDVPFFVQEKDSRFNFKGEFLLLTSYILKADGDVKERELVFVYWFLEKWR